MATLTQDLVIQQGATFEFTVQISGGPADLTGFTAAMHIRDSKLDGAALLLDLSTGDGLTLDTALRRILIEIPDMVTGALDWMHPAVYDLEMEGDGNTWRLMEGIVRLSREVTV